MRYPCNFKQLILAFSLALAPLFAAAAELGAMSVMSYLGQPLDARIELRASQEELASLSARIAPAEVYAERGQQRDAALEDIKLQLDRNAEGVTIIRLQSLQPLREPFLDLLIQIEWQGGRQLAQYTVLQEPPSADSQGTPVSLNAPPAKEHSQQANHEAPPENAEQSYITRPGDNLTLIAQRMRPENVSLEQMLVGLYRANPEAFDDNNMNRLRVGQIIKTPAQEELQAIDQSAAIEEIHVQTVDWDAYREHLAGLVAESEPGHESPQEQAAGGKITTAVEAQSAQAEAAAHDVIKLSGNKGANGTTHEPYDGLQDKMNVLQEGDTAREKAINEANERIAFLEKQIQEMRRQLHEKGALWVNGQNGAAEQPPAKPEAEKTQVPDAAVPAQEPNLLDRLNTYALLIAGVGMGLLILLAAWLFFGGIYSKRRASRQPNIAEAGWHQVGLAPEKQEPVIPSIPVVEPESEPMPTAPVEPSPATEPEPFTDMDMEQKSDLPKPPVGEQEISSVESEPVKPMAATPTVVVAAPKPLVGRAFPAPTAVPPAPAKPISLEDIDLELKSDLPEPGIPGRETLSAAELGEKTVLPVKAAPVAVPLDLSAVSLELNDEIEKSALAKVDEQMPPSETESSEIETKLDLVAAYLDMGDTRGVRELLQEALQQGGPQQRERARKFLDSLA